MRMNFIAKCNCISYFVGTGGACADVLTNCPEYSRSACQDPYVSWARKNCARFCGYCSMLNT